MTTHELSPLVAALNMQPHVEGGWYKEEWKASYQIPQSVLPDAYSGPRFSASSTYFLLHAHEISEWHTVLSDELWLWHSGSPVELKLGRQRGEPGERGSSRSGNGYCCRTIATGARSCRRMADSTPAGR